MRAALEIEKGDGMGLGMITEKRDVTERSEGWSEAEHPRRLT